MAEWTQSLPILEIFSNILMLIHFSMGYSKTIPFSKSILEDQCFHQLTTLQMDKMEVIIHSEGPYLAVEGIHLLPFLEEEEVMMYFHRRFHHLEAVEVEPM